MEGDGTVTWGKGSSLSLVMNEQEIQSRVAYITCKVVGDEV